MRILSTLILISIWLYSNIIHSVESCTVKLKNTFYVPSSYNVFNSALGHPPPRGAESPEEIFQAALEAVEGDARDPIHNSFSSLTGRASFASCYDKRSNSWIKCWPSRTYQWSLSSHCPGNKFDIKPFERHRSSCRLSSGFVNACEAEKYAEDNSCPKNPEPKMGNPVGCLSGTKYETNIVSEDNSQYPLDLKVTYRSSILFKYLNGTYNELERGMFGTLRYEPYSRKIIKTYEKDNKIILRLAANGYSEFFEGIVGEELLSNNENGKIIINNDGGYTHVDKNKVIWNFDAIGRVISKITPTGFTRTYTYKTTEDYRISTIENDLGRKLEFNYNESGLVKEVVGANGLAYHFNYDQYDNLIKIIYPDDTPDDLSDNVNERFLYENQEVKNALTGHVDESGVRVSSWNYDGEGRVTSSLGANQEKRYEFDYSERFQTTVREYLAQSQYNEKVYRFRPINGRRYVTKIQTLPCDSCASVADMNFQYDDRGNIIRKDFGEYIETYQYDNDNRNVVRVEGKGSSSEKIIITEWNETWNKPALIKKGNLEKRYTYDNNGDVTLEEHISVVSGEIRSLTFTYNNLGLLESANGKRQDVSDITYFEYDQSTGNISVITNALGHKYRVTSFNAAGYPLETLDPNGVKSQFEWSSRGNLISHKVANATSKFTYDDRRLLIESESPSGSILYYYYDDAERLIAIEDSNSNRVEYTYDSQGNKLSETIRDDKRNIVKTHQQTFNLLGNLINVIGSNDQEFQLGYDSKGNNSLTIDGKSNETVKFHDVFSRLTKIVDALDGETTLSYNENDSLIGISDAENRMTEYEYNVFGDLVKTNSTDTGVSTYTYDSAGNIVSKTDSRGVVSLYSYDALNRIVSVYYPANSETIEYQYDGTENGNVGVGRLTKVIGTSGEIEYFYSELGLLEEEKHTVDGRVYSTNYLYDDNGRQVGVVYPTGKQLTYLYDSSGKLTEIKLKNGAITQTIASELTYLPFGPLSVVSYGNGLSLFNSYDQDYRLVESEVTGLLNRDLQYNQNNNITAIKFLLNPADDQVFSYDELNRLDVANGRYGIFDFGYDLVGNRLSKNDEIYSYIEKSHLESVSDLESITFEYDANGNTIRKGNVLFEYNSASRLSSVTSGELAATYIYNGKGARSVKIVNGVETHFIYNNKGQLIAEASGEGVILKEYIYLNNQPYAQVIGNDVYYYHNSHLGTPEMMTDENQNIVWQASYTPFGKATVDVETIENNIRFPGQYYDEESGLHYNYFRDYDPETGRYIESDPIGLNAGVNTYGYVGGDPIGNIDPLGLVEWTGSGYIRSGGLGKIGVISGKFKLNSACIDGVQLTVIIDVSGGLIGVGLPLGQSDFDVVFNDYDTSLNYRNLEGEFSYRSLGVNIFGVDVGPSRFQMGNAIATNVETVGGLDIGLVAGTPFGSSSLSTDRGNIVGESCSCEEK